MWWAGEHPALRPPDPLESWPVLMKREPAGLAVKQAQGHSHTPSCCSAQVPKQFSDIRTAFQQMVLGEPGKNPGPSLTPNTKINSKWMTDLT